MQYVIGLDYGTDSCRAVLTDVEDGRELKSAVFEYPRWKKGLYCNPEKQQYRQHPLDYIEGLEYTIQAILADADEEIRSHIIGIGIDTTGSTPVAVDEMGMPLALKEEFKDNPNAMFILWKDHTAIQEAQAINEAAKNWGGIDYTKYSGGIYSSEWFFSKILKVLREDAKVREVAYSWLEHSDYIPALLTGVTDVKKIRRSRCSAGHKAMWHESFGGLPSQDFLSSIDPLFNSIRDRLYHETYTADTSAGTLSKEWAIRLGLTENVHINVGAIDCHVGAVGANIRPKSMVKVMGTSTCDVIVEDSKEVGDKLIKGICGQVDGSVLSGMIGMEAGQSSFGDVYAWYRKLLEWPLQFVPESMRKETSKKILVELEREASQIEPSSSIPLALDWFNGRRTPDANQKLEAAVVGLNLGTTAPAIYRSLIEATSFGAKAIIERIREEGIQIDEVIAIGGVAKKSPLNMQITADVLGMPIKVVREEQTVALGASIFAAVVGGAYATVEEAQTKMASPIETVYMPCPESVEIYEQMYKKYQYLGNWMEKFIREDFK